MTEQIPSDQEPQTYPAATEHMALASPPPAPDGEHRLSADSSQTAEEAAQELRVTQIEWLKRRGKLEDVPHLAMTRRELVMLRNVGIGYGGDAASHIINETKRNYGIPPDAKYALLDVAPGDASLPHVTKTMSVQEGDFGTTVDEERLEHLGVQLETIPRIAVNEREAGMFRVLGSDDDGNASYITYAKKLYGIPSNDQLDPEYALVDVESDDPNLPHEPVLMIINEVDFGTTIDRETLDEDTAYLDPSNPLSPEAGTYHTVDIREALTDSYYQLQAFATELINGKTENPLEGRFWLRAGGLAAGQKDAYVWENNRSVASAVELTIAFPSKYNSVCAVVGDRKDPANGKAGMAQIKDPEVILAIEGEDLKRLQGIYRELYRVRDFALTSEQRARRDETFNDYLASFTSEAAKRNQAREDDERRRLYEQQQPQHRYLDRS